MGNTSARSRNTYDATRITEVTEEEISNVAVTRVTRHEGDAPVTDDVRWATPPDVDVAASDPGGGMEAMTSPAASPQLQGDGADAQSKAVTGSASSKVGGVTSPTSPTRLPCLEDLAAELETRFLHCALCLRVFDEEGRSPRRLPCSHAACAPCVRGSPRVLSRHSQWCLEGEQERKLEKDGRQEKKEKKKGEKEKEEEEEEGRQVLQTLPDLTRTQLLEFIRLSEAASRKKQEVKGQDKPPETTESSVRFLASLVEELLTCAICQSLMEGGGGEEGEGGGGERGEGGRGATLLPCGHRLCQVCLKRMTADPSSSRCHECRQSFKAEDSRPDLVLDLLLKWLMTYREHVTPLTSQPDEISSRMYSLQEKLAEKEQGMEECLQQQEQGRALMRIMSLILSSRQMEDTFNQELGAASRDLAAVCLEIVQETHTLGLYSSKDVWSTAKLAYNKMLKHSANSEDFAKALARAGAVKTLTEICSHQAYVDSIATEQVSHTLKCALATLFNVCCGEVPNVEDLYLESHTAEVVVGLVREEHLEEAVTYYALRVLRKMFFTLEQHQRSLGDLLARQGLPEKCLKVLQAIHNVGFEKSTVTWETARFAYNAMRNFTLSEKFSTTLAAAGGVELLTKTCTLRKYLDEITNEDYNYVIEASLAALFNIAFEDGVWSYFTENRTAEVASALVREDYVEKGITSGALQLLAKLYERQKESREELSTKLASTGLPENLLRIAEVYTRDLSGCGAVLTRSVQQTYSAIWNFSGSSEAFAKALAERGAMTLFRINCGNAALLDNLHRELTLFIVKASLASIHNVWSRAGFLKGPEETQTLLVVGRMVRAEHAGNDLALFALTTLQMLYGNYRDQRAGVGDTLAADGIAERVLDFVKSFGKEIPLTKDTLGLREMAYSILWNFSDASEEMVKALAKIGAVEFLTENLRPKISVTEQEHETGGAATVQKSSIAILQNIARRPGTQTLFAESRTAEVLVPFIQSDDDIIWRLAAYVTLAFLVDSQDSVLVTDGGLISKLRELLEGAIDSPIRRYEGFSSVELMQYIAQLALNNEVRSQMVERDVLPTLLKLQEGGNAEEKDAALLCLERLEGEISND